MFLAWYGIRDELLEEKGASFLREANLMIILIYYRQSLVSNSLGLEPLFATVARTASVAVVLKNGWEAE